MTIVRPRALRPGDLIGICAPAGIVSREDVDAGAAALRALGFEVRTSDALFARHAFTAGTAAQRAADLVALLADDQVAGIVCARGGAGSAWLLPRLGDRVARRPKVFVGYSDITFLHLMFNATGLVTFHGPMAARELATGNYDRDSLWAALTGGEVPARDDLTVLRRGAAEGRLRGGCLSILAAAAGTPWPLRIDPEGSILFLEDVDERPYRVDRLLYQLRAAGAFDGVRGIVFGEMKGCAPQPGDTFCLEDVILEALDGLDVPIAYGLPSGHTIQPFVTLPLGVRARLACGETGRFELLEAAVS